MPIRVAIVHDYLTQHGGAERVALAMLRCFPGATLYTTIYNPSGTYEEFSSYDVRTTRLSDVAAFRRDPRRALPFLSRAVAGIEIDDADVVLASTSGWAHGITTDAPIIAYCHTPARWLYEGTNYFRGVPTALRRMFDVVSPTLMRWDRAAAGRVSRYVANSSVVAERIDRVYGIRAEVLPPPTTLGADGPQDPVPGLRPGFLLTVGRKRGYKNTDLVCDAVAELGTSELVVVGGLPERPDGRPWPSRIRSLECVSDAQLRWLYANCAGVVAMSHEDFGLTPVEGFGFGAPAVALRAGGYLDSCDNEHAAVYVPDLQRHSIAHGIDVLQARSWDRAAIAEHGEKFQLDAFFARIRGIVQEVAVEAAIAGVAAQPRSASPSAVVAARVLQPVARASRATP